MHLGRPSILFILLSFVFISPAHPARLPNTACNRILASEGFKSGLNQDTPMGPRLTFSGFGPKRPWEEIKELKLGSFNVENLFHRSEGFANRGGDFNLRARAATTRADGPTPNKPEAKIKAIADVIAREDPDILVAVEVDDLKALQYLADTYLEGKYFAVLIEGNDTRGIDVGYLVKKDLPFDLDVQSHKNATSAGTRLPGPNDPVFSRDLPVMRLRRMGAPADQKPFMALSATHYKSQIPSGSDPTGALKREIQAKRTAEILDEYEKQQVPLFLMGDFNNVPNAPEFESLRNSGLKDAFDMTDPPITGDARVTHTYHPNTGPAEWRQMDAILFSRGAQNLNVLSSAHVVPYLDAQGNPMPLPTSFAQRELQPSDHRMIAATIRFTPFQK